MKICSSIICFLVSRSTAIAMLIATSIHSSLSVSSTDLAPLPTSLLFVFVHLTSTFFKNLSSGKLYYSTHNCTAHTLYTTPGTSSLLDVLARLPTVDDAAYYQFVTTFSFVGAILGAPFSRSQLQLYYLYRL